MSRLSSLFWVLLIVVAGFTTFKVKYAVQDIEDQLARARKQTIAEQQEIRVLTAEWSYLNQPERLADLNRRFFGLAPIAAKQLQHRIEDIPLRPPAPISEPELAIATNAAPEPAPAGDAARLPTPTPSASVAARTPRPAAAPAAVANATPTPMTAVAAAASLLSVAPAAHAATPQPAAATPRPQVQIATITAGSLDALIAHIAEPR